MQAASRRLAANAAAGIPARHHHAAASSTITRARSGVRAGNAARWYSHHSRCGPSSSGGCSLSGSRDRAAAPSLSLSLACSTSSSPSPSLHSTRLRLLTRSSQSQSQIPAQRLSRRALHASSSSLQEQQQQSTRNATSTASARGESSRAQLQPATTTAAAEQQRSADKPSTSNAESQSEAPAANAEESARSPKDVSVGEVRRLMSLARPEKRTLSIALGLLAVSSAVSLSVPFTLGRIIDLFTSPSSSELPVSLPAAAAILATVFAVGAAANTGRSILMRISGQRIVQRLRIDAYTNTLKLDMARFDMMGQHTTDKDGKKIAESDSAREKEKIVTYDSTTRPPSEQQQQPEDRAKTEEALKAEQDKPKQQSRLSSALSLSSTSETTPDVGVKGVGDVISRLGSDASIVGESLTRELSEGLRAAATVLVGVGMMVYISTKLTLLMLCIVPPTAIGAVFYGRYLKKLSRRTQKSVGEMIALAEERLSSVRTVQAFNAVEPTETARFTKKAGVILDLAKKEAYASGLFFGGAGFSGNLTLLALLTYGGKLVANGEITVGDLSSLMLYTAYVGSSLVGLTSFFSVIMKALGAAARVFELLDSRPASVQLSVGKKLPASLPPQPIQFRDVHFSYPSRPGTPILRGVNLSIERGRSVAIAGGSGSGKSTLVNLLVRYYDPSSGSISYGSEDVRAYTPESWRARVSIVPQDPALFSQTVAENIAYGKPDATMSEIREAAHLANCTEFIEALPQGFDTPVGAKAAQISGGQRQRLAIARALVRKPAVLILDEATSALDAASETLVNQAVKRITDSNSLMTILIAHRLSTLKTADEIVFMQDGKVVERGTYEELAREGTQFWQMVRSQMLGTATGVSTGPEAEQKSKTEEEEAMKA